MLCVHKNTAFFPLPWEDHMVQICTRCFSTRLSTPTGISAWIGPGEADKMFRRLLSLVNRGEITESAIKRLGGKKE